MPPRTKWAIGPDRARNAILADCFHPHDHTPIIDQQGITLGNILDHPAVVDGGGEGQTRFTVPASELKFVPLLQREGLRQGAGSNGGALKIEKQPDSAAPRCVIRSFPDMA